MSRKEKKKQAPKQEVSLGEMLAAQEELRALKEQYGIEDENKKKEGWISKAVSAMFAGKEPMPINKKKYLWLAVLTGWFGGHRFYAKHYKTGALYLAFCWLGIGLYHTILDILQVIPMQPDENGIIYL